jgi:hypothetical protein
MTLFDVTPVALPPPAEKLSPDRRRTLRQRHAVARGVHPLALVFGPSVRVLDDPGRTCGDCRFRQLLAGGARHYSKCVFGDGARASRSAATDVRAWWPACTDHEWGDHTTDSPDAARWVPPKPPPPARRTPTPGTPGPGAATNRTGSQQ